jgi:hypothetical protein
MNSDEAVTAFMNLSADQQVRALATYAFRLTINARSTYAPGSGDIADPHRLRFLNEVQHRVIGHICKLLALDQERYSDNDLARIAIEDGDPELLASFMVAIESVNSNR